MMGNKTRHLYNALVPCARYVLVFTSTSSLELENKSDKLNAKKSGTIRSTSKSQNGCVCDLFMPSLNFSRIWLWPVGPSPATG